MYFLSKKTSYFQEMCHNPCKKNKNILVYTVHVITHMSKKSFKYFSQILNETSADRKVFFFIFSIMTASFKYIILYLFLLLLFILYVVKHPSVSR